MSRSYYCLQFIDEETKAKSGKSKPHSYQISKKALPFWNFYENSMVLKNTQSKQDSEESQISNCFYLIFYLSVSHFPW